MKVRMIGGASSGGRTLKPGDIVEGKERDLRPLVAIGTAEWYEQEVTVFRTVKDAQRMAPMMDLEQLHAARLAEETEGGGRVGVVDALTRRIDELTQAVGEG